MKHWSLPWSIVGLNYMTASTTEDDDRAVSIAAADGETIVANRVDSEFAAMIVKAVNEYYRTS